MSDSDDLEQVDQEIDEAQDDAERDIEPGDDEPRYVDSGTIRPDLDDQTITPG